MHGCSLVKFTIINLLSRSVFVGTISTTSEDNSYVFGRKTLCLRVRYCLSDVRNQPGDTMCNQVTQPARDHRTREKCKLCEVGDVRPRTPRRNARRECILSNDDFRRVMPLDFPLRGRPVIIISEIDRPSTHQRLYFNLREKATPCAMMHVTFGSSVAN